MTIAQAFDLAVQRHQAGRSADAEAIYRQILAIQPSHAGALHLLGVVACQTGRHGLAADLIRRAIGFEPYNPVAHSNLSEACRAMGRFDEAIAACRRALELQPDFPNAHLNLGNARRDQGLLDEAIADYRRALQWKPDYPEAHNNLGNALRQRGEIDEAIAAYRLALQFKPDYSEACYNLGAALQDGRRLEEATAAYRRAIELHPEFPEAHCNLGVTLREQGQLDEAIGAFRRAFEIKPNYPEAFYHLGAVLRRRGQLDGAVAAYRRALELKPEAPEVHHDLAIALKDRGQFDDSFAAYRRALELKPDYPEALNNLGAALAERGQFEDSIANYHRALQLRPDYPEACYNLGAAFHERGQLEEAIAAYCRALELKPEFPDAFNNMGATLAERGQLEEAIGAYRHALGLNPDHPEAWNNLGNALREQGRLDEAISAYRRALELTSERSGMHSNLVYTLHFHPGHDGRSIFQEQQRWNRQFADPLMRFAAPDANDRKPERRLRIGYVSPDFRDHVVGRNLIPLFRHHDIRDFEIVCYSGVVRPDDLTDEFRRRAQLWRSTVGVGDEAVAGMIRRDEVDILVDLTQHLASNRLPVFARKPAPVQVSFAGYPESAGLEAIEYRISDRHLEGGSADEGCGGQEQVCLIDSFWCYDPLGIQVEVNALPALESKMMTFGSLGNFSKVNEAVLKLWARVLGKVENSRLLIWSPAGSHRQEALGVLEGEGIKVHRVEFVEFRPRREHLEVYHRLDMVLDTFPYNGHTTSLDALWMGVPVVSMAGKTRVSRAGLSQLMNIGVPELVAHSETEYVDIAENLARDTSRLVQLRSTLRDRMENSVLMDAPRFARNVESVYREIWREWTSKQPSVS